MTINSTQANTALLTLAIDGWRFSRAYLRLIKKLDAGDQSRYVSQFQYFQKQLEDRVGEIGYKLVNIEGQLYNPGLAVTALNVGDFHSDDKLIIEQMLEPIIMNDNGLVKPGTVLLRKAEII